MTAEKERQLLARATELAEDEELVEMLVLILARARSSRVEPDALKGLETAILALDGDPKPAMRRRYGDRFGHYVNDVAMFEAMREADAEMMEVSGEVNELDEEAQRDRRRALADRRKAETELAAAQAMKVHVPCDGCHAAREAAIATARMKIADAKERFDYATDAIEILGDEETEIPMAIGALRTVPDTYEDVYAPELELMRRDPKAMPRDGDFITGHGARLMPRVVSGSAAKAIRSALELGKVTDRTEDGPAAPAGPTVPGSAAAGAAGPPQEAPHQYSETPDDKYPHLAWASCTGCGWRASGFATAGANAIFYGQHIKATDTAQAGAGETQQVPPARVVLTDGETREITKRWPDGSYSCPYCESPVIAGRHRSEWDRGCENPGCTVNMTAEQLAAFRQREAAQAERRREREALDASLARMAEDRRREEAELWAKVAAEATERGACLECLRRSCWRSHPKFVRHRTAHHHAPRVLSSRTGA
jgi:hypothetical protein